MTFQKKKNLFSTTILDLANISLYRLFFLMIMFRHSQNLVKGLGKFMVWFKEAHSKAHHVTKDHSQGHCTSYKFMQLGQHVH